MKTLRYIEGNELTLYIPAVLLTANGPTYVAASNLSQISVHLNNISLVPMTSGNNVLVQLGSTLKAGMYSLDVKAMYEGRKVRLHVDGAVEIVGTSRQSNWQDFITASTATVDAQIYIADSLMTDEEFEALKDEYQGLIDELEEAIADAEAAKEEADAAAYNAANTLTQEGIQSAVEAAMEGVSVSVDLTPVTTRLDSTTYGLQAIKTAVDNIEVDVPTGIAMESNATANKNAIIAAIPSVPTDYAKETTALAAKNAAEAAKTAAENITIPSDVARVTDLPTDYAKAANIPTVSAIQNGLATSSQVSQIDQKLGDFDDSTAADEIADIKEAVGDALDEVAGDVSGYVSNAQLLTAIGAVSTAMYKGFPKVAAEGDVTALPNQMYVWSADAGNLTITKGAEVEGIVNEYCFRFTGADAVEFDGWELTWSAGDAPEWDASKTYEISIVDDIALYNELEVEG